MAPNLFFYFLKSTMVFRYNELIKKRVTGRLHLRKKVKQNRKDGQREGNLFTKKSK